MQACMPSPSYQSKLESRNLFGSVFFSAALTSFTFCFVRTIIVKTTTISVSSIGRPLPGTYAHTPSCAMPFSLQIAAAIFFLYSEEPKNLTDPIAP
jgi:hypothetical protein